MDEADFEGTLVLEQLATIDKVEEFFDAIDSDDTQLAASLMRRAKLDAAIETADRACSRMPCLVGLLVERARRACRPATGHHHHQCAALHVYTGGRLSEASSGSFGGADL